MNSDRLETLTEQTFRLNSRVTELETNAMLLGVAVILTTFCVFLVSRERTR